MIVLTVTTRKYRQLPFFLIAWIKRSPTVSSCLKAVAASVTQQNVWDVCPFAGLALFEMKGPSKPSNFIIQQKEKLQKQVEELLGTDGVFLYPSHPRVAPKHHHPLFRPFDFAYTGESYVTPPSPLLCGRFSHFLQAADLICLQDCADFKKE